MRGAAPRIVHSSLVEAKVAIYGVPDFGGIRILLAVVLPPANRTEREGVCRVQCPVPAAWASKKNRGRPHAAIDGFWRDAVTGVWR